MVPLSRARTPSSTLFAFALVTVLLAAGAASAQIGGRYDSGGPYEPMPPSEEVHVPRGEDPCENLHPEWRDAQTVMGVDVQESLQCEPDDPRLVAAFVKGTNNVPEDVLDELALHKDAVVKCCDEDGDGDPDVINVTLEINELNGWHLASDVLGQEPFMIAPGIAPSFWVFSPKTTIHHSGEAWSALVRMPSAPLRIEQGDTLHLTIENTHYFPHTVHLHGSDHPFLTEDGQGNDGVPHVSEKPILPGESRTYTIKPRVPGTQYYHCHVQPQVHVLMGLSTLLIVEEARPNNTLQTLNPGGGHVRHPSAAIREQYDREYDLVYQDVDADLNAIPQDSNDPRVVAQRMNRGWKAPEADPEYFLLNGRAFPYTLRESVIVVDENELVKLRVLNGGTSPLSLHGHGHKFTRTHVDGVPLPEAGQVQRDVFTLTAAQRIDLEINTTNDGLNAYGPGLWFMHDHREEATTTNGINPGGDITVIAYPGFIDPEDAMPVPQAGKWDVFFNAAYYRGEIPVWHHLGMDNIWGEVNITSTHAESGTEGATTHATPAPAAALAALAVAAAALARRRWR